MFWSIDNDDFRGDCHGKPFPIIEAAKEALLNALGISEITFVDEPESYVKSKNKGVVRQKPTKSSKVENDNLKVIGLVESKKPTPFKSSSRSQTRAPSIRNNARTTASSLSVTTRTTPSPPTTPSSEGGKFYIFVIKQP